MAHGTTTTTRYFCYDANGNLTKETGDMPRTLSWASYNKPTSITSGTTQETFLYGPSRERLQTTVTTASSTVTTTYIDGLFEQVQDNAGNITYKHYILAGSARVGVETVATTNGTVNSDTLSFFVQDQVGSVIAEVTEGLGGLNQQLTVYGHDPWGKARPTSGTGANLALLPGIFQPASAVMAGQHEGFAGHEDLEDIGIVDMEGRIYDPEVGRFLSADPTVQYPDSSQGYNRYTYCNSNPLSLSDPTGYSYLGDKAQEGMHLAFYAILAYLSGGAASEFGYAGAFGGAAITGYVSSGGNVHTAILSGLEAMAFTYVGDKSQWFHHNPQGLELLGRSAVEGVIGGAFSRAGGGSFGDGFIGSFVGSETSNIVDDLAPNNEAERMAISAMIGGTAASLSGGNFTTAAISAAMQRLFNDQVGDTNMKRCGDPSGCIEVKGPHGEVYYLPPGDQDDASKIWFRIQTNQPADYDSCGSGCKQKIIFAAATGVSIITGGLSLAYGAGSLVVDETAAGGLEAAATNLKIASVVSGGVALKMQPSVKGAFVLGVSTLPLFFPIPGASVLMDAISFGLELNEQAEKH